MRYRDHGNGYSVSVRQDEVQAFRSHWPCSGLPDRGVTFQFDAGGDLVDIWWHGSGETFDGEAVAALASDARRYGERRRPWWLSRFGTIQQGGRP